MPARFSDMTKAHANRSQTLITNMPDTAIMDPATMKFNFVVYVLHFFGDAVVRYVGVTQFEKDREKQHYEAMSGAPRVVQARIAYGECESKVVAGLYGTLREAQALETYLMKKFGTIVTETKERIEMRLSEKNPKRLPWPDVALYPDVPASKQLNCRVSASPTKYADEIAAAGKAYEAGQTPPPNLSEAEQKELHALVESHWEGKEWVTAGEADDPCGIVFEVDSPFARARELKEQYEDLEPHTLVDRDVVAGQLTSIGQHSLRDEGADKEVEGMIRLWQQVVSPNKERLHGKPLTAGYAATVFSLAYQWCGDHEEGVLLGRLGIDAETAAEEKLPASCKNTNPVDSERISVVRALSWRRWTEENDGRKPKSTGRTDTEKSEEEKICSSMSHWRNGKTTAARRHQSFYLLLLRHHKWFDYYTRGEYATGGDATKLAKDVNRMLQLGFGTRAEVETGAAVRIIPRFCSFCGGSNKIHQTLSTFLRGSNAKLSDAYLATGGALSATRAAALKNIHASNVEKECTRKVAVNLTFKEAVQASGRGKKRKGGDSGEASSPPDAN